MSVPALPLPTTPPGHGETARVIRTTLAAFYTKAGRTDRACYVLAGVLVVSGLVHFGVLLATGGQWTGALSWREAGNFGVAFGVTLAAVCWASTFVRLSPGTRAVLVWAFAVACTVEVLVAIVQAWRGVPFFFNSTTPFNALCAYSAAGGGAVIVLSGIGLTVPALTRRHPGGSPSLWLAAAVGFFGLLIGLGTGVVMIVFGERVAGSGGSAIAAYHASTVLVGAHAVSMQGILVLPVVAWLATFTTWSEASRTRVVALACAGYLVCTSAVVIESALGANPVVLSSAPLAATVLALAGIAGVLVAAFVTVWRLFSPRG